MVVSGIAPFTTRYADESRYFGMRSAMSVEKCGASSDGFRTAQHPAAMAPRSGCKVRIAGEFHGL